MDVHNILGTHYGFINIEIKHLEGFENKTYGIGHKGQSFVFKQYAYTEEMEALIIAEDRILKKLAEIDSFNFPATVATKAGQSYIVQDGHLFRLLTFVEGKLLGSVERSNTHFKSLGVLLGRMDRKLSEVNEPLVAARQDEWDLRYCKKNLKYLSFIESAADRNLVRYFFMQFDQHIRPLEDELRRGLIHNDANDWNIVCEKDRISGIFDFGDLAYTWLINELAIGITYMMMGRKDPLAASVEVIKGYHEEFPLEEIELDLLYYLVAARLCVSVCNSAHGKAVKPDSEYVVISEKKAWDLLHKWKTINPILAQNTFREAVGFSRKEADSTPDLLSKRNTYLSKSLSLSYNEPIAMTGAAFQYMYDKDGNTYLDAYNNIMLAGHCHPHVVITGQQMMAQINTNTRYLYDIIHEYCANLLTKFPGKLNKIFLVNSGSEASDLAIRMARYHTQRNKILVLENGYHGNSSTGIQISHYKYAAPGGIGRSDAVIETPMPKAFGSGIPDDGSCGKHFASITAEKIESFYSEIAAFIAEPVMGCGGQVPLARSYLKRVYSLIRDQGGVCISDEVQVGFGRLGSCFWGFEMHEVIPDIVVLGKPMANGHPMGAVITTEQIASSFEKGPEFFSSFGGNPVSCAIGNAVLEVIEEEKLQKKALETGNYLIELLRKVQKKHPVLGDIRGNGMFIGVELIDPTNQNPLTELSQLVKNRLREQFVLIGTDGPHQNVLKIKPPLSFNKENAVELASKIEAILAEEL